MQEMHLAPRGVKPEKMGSSMGHSARASRNAALPRFSAGCAAEAASAYDRAATGSSAFVKGITAAISAIAFGTDSVQRPAAACADSTHTTHPIPSRAISHLDHPHICTLYDVGEDSGTAYLVMQYLEGETLENALQKIEIGL